MIPKAQEITQPLPKAEEIQQIESNPISIPVEPWVAAHISRLWQGMKKNIQISTAVGTKAQPRSVQSVPASSHNHS